MKTVTSLPVVVLMILGISQGMQPSTGWTQAPATLTENPLQGVVDFHVHSGPDSFTRSVTDLEIARIARANGMSALVFKNHFTMTGDRAYLAELEVPGIRCYGGIVLNHAVGGLNPFAIERMVTFTGQRAKVVWLPTFDALNHVKRFDAKRPGIAVVEKGKPVPELKAIFALVAKHNLVLSTGHASSKEVLILLEAARRAGVEQMLVTHAMADPIRMSVSQMKQAAMLGAKLECVWASNLQGDGSHLPGMRLWKKVTTEDYAKAIRAVGVEHFILSSDLGQYLNPLPTDGMKAFILELQSFGFSGSEIDLMCRKNPRTLLGF